MTGLVFLYRGYACSPPIIHVAIYEVTTLMELRDLIRATLDELQKNGQLQKEVTMQAIMYKYPGELRLIRAFSGEATLSFHFCLPSQRGQL